MEMNLEKLRQKIAKILNVDPVSLDETTIFSELEQWDSFAKLSVVALFAEYTGKQLIIQEVEKLANFDDLMTLFNIRRVSTS